jgi:hypothetical protein
MARKHDNYTEHYGGGRYPQIGIRIPDGSVLDRLHECQMAMEDGRGEPVSRSAVVRAAIDLYWRWLVRRETLVPQVKSRDRSWSETWFSDEKKRNELPSNKRARDAYIKFCLDRGLPMPE